MPLPEKQNLYNELETVLQNDQSLVSDGKLLKNAVIERALRLDAALMEQLLQSDVLKQHFFTDLNGVLIFDKTRFQDFVSSKQFLPDSYTSFKNKIGLKDHHNYIRENRNVVLAWPYKDCVLEGGMTKEAEGRDEIFWNQILAPDEVTRIFEPKALTNFEQWDYDAITTGKPKQVTEIPENPHLLIKGNNLLTLHSLKEQYAESIDLIYIDPPYNPPSNANTFLYNNRFNHSSWLTFMKNRLDAAKRLLRNDGCLIVAIDHNEFYFLGVLLDELFPEFEIHCITIVHNPRGVQGANFSYTHEYAYFVLPAGQKVIGSREIAQEDIDWANFRNWGTESRRSDAKNCFYSVKVKDGKIIGFGDVLPDDVHPNQTEDRGDHYEVFPIDTKGCERKWRYARASADQIQHLLRARPRNGGFEIELGKDFGLYRTVWQDTRYDANEYGTKILKSLVPECSFSFPKSIWTVYDCLNAVVGHRPNAKVLDFFAGSGTTGHAVLELNKRDNGNRRFLLAEQLDYIQDTTKRRLQEYIRREERTSEIFVYCEMKEWNEALRKTVQKANTDAELFDLWTHIRNTAYLHYDIIPEHWDDSEFGELGHDEKKKVLIECLNANHLYVNYRDIADVTYEVTAQEITLNRQFYGDE